MRFMIVMVGRPLGRPTLHQEHVSSWPVADLP